MNSKSILKRTLPLIAVLVVIIGIAIACTVFSGTRAVPNITNADDDYASYKIGTNTYTVKNDSMYKILKPQGLSTVIEWVDKTILKAEKNENGDSYFDLALADTDELTALKDETIYGDEEAKKALTDEQLAEKEEEYEENMKASGFVGVVADTTKFTAAEKDYFAVTNAKKLYAYDQLAKDIAEQDKKAEDTAHLDDDDDDKELPYFTDTAISNYYSSNANYRAGYWAIIIEYASTSAAKRSLSQLGIEVEDSAWVWTNNTDADGKKVALTAGEILKAHIQLYNNANGYKTTGVTELVSSEEFNFAKMSTSETADEKTTYKFNPAACEDIKDYFFYTYEELNTLNSSVRNRINGSTLKKFFEINDGADVSGSAVKGYQVEPYAPSSNYYYILKLDVVEARELYDDDDETVINAEIKAEIVKALTEEAQTDSLVTSKMAELRKEKGLLIFDTVLETAYTSNHDTSFEASKVENKTNILKITIDGEDKYLSTDEYFETINSRMGATYLIDLINRQLVLSSDSNKVIGNYNPNMSYNDIKNNIIDTDTWNDVLTGVQNLKTQFAGNAFSSYNFPSSYGWTNFLRDFFLNYYGTLIESEEDLVVYYIYQEVLSEYADTLNNYTDSTETKTYYTTQMQAEYDKYFSASGYHILISVNDAEGEMSSPLDENTAWTAEQKTAAEQLYLEILDILDKASNPTAALENFASQFSAAPFFTLYTADGTLFTRLETATQPDITTSDDASNPYLYIGLDGNVTGVSVEISKYKSLGLNVRYETLSTFGAGKMTEKFENVAKYMWRQLYNDGGITYNNTTSAWEVSNTKYVANQDVVRGATNNEEEYLVTEFGYHVYVQSGASGYTGMTPTATNTETGEVRREYKEVRIPTVAEITSYLDIINSDEYKDIIEDENYEDGDEDELFEDVLTDWQLLCITTYYTPIETEYKNQYNISISLVNQQIANIDDLTLSHNNFDKTFYQFILGLNREYNIENLTYLKDLYSPAEE